MRVYIPWLYSKMLSNTDITKIYTALEIQERFHNKGKMCWGKRFLHGSFCFRWLSFTVVVLVKHITAQPQEMALVN